MFPLEVCAKPMFGDYGLYFEGKNFALVNDNILYIKVTDAAVKSPDGSPKVRRTPGPNRPSRSRHPSKRITTG
jgi:TfoX/Sxy family transcriptional regulator of competence genes